MHLARFDAFVQEVRHDRTVKALCGPVRVYRFWASAWHDEEGGAPADDELKAHLKRALASAQGDVVAGRDVFARVVSLQAVVVATFASRPQKKRREEFAAVLQGCLEHAQHAFDATHDPLTGLVNRKGMEHFVERVWKTTTGPIGKTAESVVRSSPTISLIAFDLDHFKQVNDTHGHLYGDKVLQAFARRLGGVVARFQFAQPDEVPVCAARMGGEEFLIIVAGTQSRAEVNDLAETVRTAVAETPLPSREEWDGSAEVSLPHDSERKVTVSVGISSPRAIMGSTAQNGFLDALAIEADAALYRAKAAGRNIVRWFDDIRANAGRVLEQHVDTSIVAIDIGKQVGVTVGQEFLVFHPDFSGDKPFLRSDGRSTRRLGTYPRTSSGTITAFEVQQDISFCSVDKGGPFVQGSHLKAIEIGSISHLIDDRRERGPADATDGADALTAAIQKAGAKEFAVGVVNLDDIDSVSKRNGSAFVNGALAQLYSVLRSELGLDARIVQTGPYGFGFFVNDDVALVSFRDTLSKIIGEARKKSGRDAMFSCGYFETPYTRAPVGDLSEIVLTEALSLAKYAALLAPKSEDSVRRFDADVPREVVYASRMTSAYAKVYADYEAFRRFGVRAADLENQVTLVAIADGNQEQALASSLRALELAPKAPGYAYYTNRAIVLFQFVDRVQSWTLYSTALEVTNGRIPDVYVPTAAMAAYAAQAAGAIEPVISLALLKRAAVIEGFRSGFGVTKADIDAAIAELEARGLQLPPLPAAPVS